MVTALVLVSAFLHATWNALLRLEPDKDRGVVAAIGVASAFALVVAGIRWGLGAVPFATTESFVWTVIAGVAEAIYFTTLARALERGRLGPVYTISRGGAVLVVWPASILLFAEVVTWRNASGSAIVLAGLVLCGIGAGAKTAGRATDDRAGIAWATACALSIAGYHMAYKAALLAGANGSASFALSLTLSWLLSVVRLGRPGRSALAAVYRTRLPRVLLMGITCSSAFLLLMEALARSGSGHVLTLRNTSVLFAALFAALVGDRPTRAELVGAIAVAGGAALMVS